MLPYCHIAVYIEPHLSGGMLSEEDKEHGVSEKPKHDTVAVCLRYFSTNKPMHIFKSESSSRSDQMASLWHYLQKGTNACTASEKAGLPSGPPLGSAPGLPLSLTALSH